MAAADRGAARRLLRERRARLAPEQRSEAQALIFAQVEALILSLRIASPVVAAYWPLPGEPDCRTAMSRWHGLGWHLALPRVVIRDAPLAFEAWRPGDPLVPGPFGTAHPQHRHPLRPDVLVIPCLGFDAERHRLGYGGGFYDRSIAQLLADGACPRLIGVAWACQRVSDLRPTAHDRALDHIVTEAQVLPAPRSAG